MRYTQHMLISCPKCGFNQPKDQFCAKCGVNIAAYSPKKKSLVQVLLFSPAFHIIIVTLLSISAIFYIRQSRLGDLKQQIDDLDQQSSPLIIEKKSASPSEVTGETFDPEVALQQRLSETLEGTSADQGEALESSLSDEKSSSGGQEAKNLNATGDRIEKALMTQFVFAEVDKEELKKWIETNSGSASKYDESTQWGVVPNASLKQLKSLNKLSEDEKPFSSSETQFQLEKIQSPSEEDSGDLGLILASQASDFTDQSLRLELEVMKNLKEANTINRRSYSSAFNLLEGQVFYMAGILSKSTESNTQESERRSDPLFRILESKTFDAGQTDLVLFVFVNK
jgi:hypothetical protein